jgi:hypothetical protein
MFKQKVLLAAAMVVLGAASLIGASPVATAESSLAPCTPGGYLNGYASSNTCTQFIFSIGPSVPIGECHNVPGSQVTYIWNDTSHQFKAWTGSGCTGTSGPLYAKTAGPMAGAFYKHVYSIQRVN